MISRLLSLCFSRRVFVPSFGFNVSLVRYVDVELHTRV